MKILFLLSLICTLWAQSNSERFLKVYDRLDALNERILVLEKEGSLPKKEKESVVKELNKLHESLRGESLGPQALEERIASLESAVAAKSVGDNQIWLNTAWVLVAGFLVMFMQIGFAMVEIGLTRSKNVVHTLSMNFMDYAIGMLVFWAFGFALMFGNSGAFPSLGIAETALNRGLVLDVNGSPWSFLGLKGFFLGADAGSSGVATLFFFQMVFAATANTICTGALAERWKFKAFSLSSLFVAGIIYPLFGNWVWGGGWLSAKLGYIDFAGSTVVHAVGGIIALAGAMVLGPRIDKFKENGEARPIPGHNLPFVFLGTSILAFGWFGFNAGSSLAADGSIAMIAVNTALSSGAGALVAMLVTQIKFGMPDPTFCCNGLLAGLVGITAGCANVSPWAAVLIGTVSGILVVFSALFLEEKMKIDDPVGAISVHGTCGIWGGIAVGVFALPGEGFAGGLLYGGIETFLVQCLGCLICFAVVFPLGLGMFKLIGILTPLRPSEKEEKEGLDLSEMGVEGYSK